jgi:UDP-N-acetylglucosamine 2-epimerase (non-hydrolysing)
MEAGNRCFDQRVPEETNRKIVDHISDINLTYSDIAREYLLREGLPADRIIKTGSPMFEVLTHYLPEIESSPVLSKLGLEKGKYFVVSSHREENINSEKNFNGLINSLNTIAEKYNYPIIVSTHPRTRNMIEAKAIKVRPEVQFLKPLGFNDYNALQMNAYAVLSDSGTISEESSILNFRALNIRDAHERPEAMEETSVMMVGMNTERILQGLTQLQYQKTGDERTFRKVNDYSMPNVSDKVVRIIISYVDYIRRVVWSEAN